MTEPRTRVTIVDRCFGRDLLLRRMWPMAPLARLMAAAACTAAVLVPSPTGAVQAARVLPPDTAALTAALDRAAIHEAPLASCRGEFRVGHGGEFVVALGTAAGGRYVLVQDDGKTMDLAAFEGAPELQCYSVRQADALTAEIAQSDTRHGRITAEWDGLVACGAITPSIVVCWQHAVERRGFVRVGGWMH